MRAFPWFLMIGLTCIFLAGAGAEEASAPLLLINDAPRHGVVIAPVDLTWALKEPPDTLGIRAETVSDGSSVPVQFVPDADFDTHARATGTLLLKLPHGGDWKVRLALEGQPAAMPVIEDDVVRTEHCTLRFAADRMGGLLSAITFAGTDKCFDSFAWNDRVYDRELGGFYLRHDPAAKPEAVCAGPLCTVIRVQARYCRPDGSQPPSQPQAVYDWYVFDALPLVFVTAAVRQEQPFVWHELHLLELNFPDESFLHWAGGEPQSGGEFTGSKQSYNCAGWGALLDGRNAIGMFGGPVKFYDDRGGYGTYMHATWRAWDTLECRMAAWLWIGTADNPTRTVQEAAGLYGGRTHVVLTRPELHKQIQDLDASARNQEGPEGQDTLWRAAMAGRLEAQGRLEEAERLIRGELPEGWRRFASGELGLVVAHAGGGAALQSVFDLGAGQELLAPDNVPVFGMTLRHAETKEQAHVTAQAGWDEVQVNEAEGAFTITWAQPADDRFRAIRVSATATPDSASNAWRWSLAVDNPNAQWSIWNVKFPQTAVADLGDGAAVLFPRGPGELKRNAWQEDFSFRGRYPSGWCSMQLMAAYKEPTTGLYLACHDPFGSTKEITLESLPDTRCVRLAFEHPAPDMGVAGNDFTLSGEAVWQLLRGDWFDAATIYKTWVRQHARWWPKLGEDGRADTPLWMRELSVWAQTGGAPGECVPAVKEFARYLDVPVGFHWYNWHQIPFDNDYPHYFPTKEGFAEAVGDLRQANVFVMPYINGRLWDTRDKVLDDFEFTKVALPAVTKDENGEPYTEMYGSKEQDGSRVRLGVMCPATQLWQDRIKDIVLRLQQEQGVSGVYIDQIAAAAPKLCMDKTHGHPLGGGHWWNEGYWRMLDGIRSAMAPERMITSECNAEPFTRWLDGYLTWHWQYDGQVPVFPAIYGGAVQMFGRAYRGGDTKDLALRMKAGQQLVFGEQLGWLNPSLLKEVEHAEFFRKAAQLRWYLRRYFYAGEMARPPKLTGDIPAVRADWQWSGEWWVTTDAVMTGAWQIPSWELPRENKLVLIFANVSDDPVKATLHFDGTRYGLTSDLLRVSLVQGREGPRDMMEVPSRFERPLDFAARTPFAWEVQNGE